MLFRAYLVSLFVLAGLPWFVPESQSHEFNNYKSKPSLPVLVEKPIRIVPQPTLVNKKQLSPHELKWVLEGAGFEGESLKTAWAIAMRESGGRPRAHNPNRSTGDNSYGLFQINMHGDLAPTRRAKFELTRNEELFNPHTNAKIAYHMSRRGADFGAWAIGANSYREDRSRDLRKWLLQYPK